MLLERTVHGLTESHSETMTIPIYQVDAFSARVFGGNPAAVCLLDQPRDEQWMQQLASEMNLSETAFLEPAADGYGLRWFTPAVEVDLCGHATLASAHILWSEGHAAENSPLTFHSRSGKLLAELVDGRIQLDFPSKPQEPCEPAEGMLESLGIETPEYVGRNQFDYLVEVKSVDELKRLRPDHQRLATIGVRGVIVTTVSDDSQFDFVSRFFAPGAGIEEDPVTGSAHCCLGPYWQQRIGKDQFRAFQASKRGGVVNVRVAGERTFLSGEACTVFKGTLSC